MSGTKLFIAVRDGQSFAAGHWAGEDAQDLLEQYPAPWVVYITGAPTAPDGEVQRWMPSAFQRWSHDSGAYLEDNAVWRGSWQAWAVMCCQKWKGAFFVELRPCPDRKRRLELIERVYNTIDRRECKSMMISQLYNRIKNRDEWEVAEAVKTLEQAARIVTVVKVAGRNKRTYTVCAIPQ